jgi:uncharacterized protein (DUF885 family)
MLKMFWMVFVGMLIALGTAFGSALAGDSPTPPSPDDAFNDWAQHFVLDYRQLAIPQHSLSYVDNFASMQDLAGIRRQKAFFTRAGKELHLLARQGLRPDFKYEYDVIDYEIQLALERLALEQDYRQHAPGTIPTGGLLQVRNGQAWYRHYIKRWTSKTTAPDELIRFGESEVARVRGEMARIQAELGFAGQDQAFYQHLQQASQTITDEAALRQSFLAFRSLIQSRLGIDFEGRPIPLPEIEASANPTKDTPPGYYAQGVFHYNFFNHRFNQRALEWLYIHEAVPGHHYQVSLAPATSRFKGLFWYGGFVEGWATYAEDLGKDLGAYQDPYRYFGKWEWDLVRSARVVLDIGLNSQGWSKAKALQYWREHVPNQEAIAEREIDRMLRWPGQVLAYKVGESEFLRLRERSRKHAGNDFDLRRFHTAVLQRGSLPFSVLEQVVDDDDGQESGRK